MCLQVVDHDYIPDATEQEAWKVFIKNTIFSDNDNKNGKSVQAFEFMYTHYEGSVSVPREQWLQANLGGSQTIGLGNRAAPLIGYNAGFHVFSLRQDAVNHCSTFCSDLVSVVKVKVRNVRTRGLDKSNLVVLVADEMFVPLEQEKG